MRPRPLIRLLSAVLVLVSGGAAAQVPGEFPHLRLTDNVSVAVPPLAGPFDNSHEFPVLAGQQFTAQLSYASLGQPNTNVLWALLVSLNKTPFPQTSVPPPLFTMPPFSLILPTPATLNVAGAGALDMVIPAGLPSGLIRVQGVIHDVTSAPALRLSNGVTISVQVPAYNIRMPLIRNKELGTAGSFDTFGQLSIAGSQLKTFTPLGTSPPPQPTDPPYAPPKAGVTVTMQPGLLVDRHVFLPILPNNGAEPINPLARPMTRITGSVTGTATTITVEDTSFFPSRGQLLIAFNNANLWANKTSGGAVAPFAEVVSYEGITPTSFLNCQRKLLGSTGATSFAHVAGEVVLGEYTMATTADARTRTRVGLDADNVDMPHVVIPPFTFTPVDGGPVTMDLDVYLYETVTDKVQGFMVFDRASGQWRPIPGTERNPFQGRWNPMVCVAPDGRSLLATLSVPGGVLGWDNKVDELHALRLDGLNWPASGSQTWSISWQVEADPATVFVVSARSRRVIMRSTAIIGPNPENYVAFVGLAHKFKQSTPTPGANFETDNGFEGVWVREEVLVRDLFELPLVPPGSSKAAPTMPRPWITTQFGNTAFGGEVRRFDPEVLPSDDNTRLFIIGGRKDTEEAAFVIRNVGINAGGGVDKVLVDVVGSVDKREMRPPRRGGHGRGRTAAFSPDGSRVAWLVRDTAANTQRKDWINVALSSGASFGQVQNVYQLGADFKEAGALKTDRVVTGLRFLDNNRLLFMMGRNPHDDPLPTSAGFPPAMDLFVYDIPSNLITNLTKTDGSTSGFGDLGKINPGGSFASSTGAFTYFLRFGGSSSVGGSALPPGTPVTNLVGVNSDSLQVFAVSGDEFGPGALIPNLRLPDAECVAPVETAASLRLLLGGGVQDGLVWVVSHRQGGNGADDIFAFNRDVPFVSFAATAHATPGTHVRNVTPSPYSGKLAFSRTSSTSKILADEHPWVIDLDNFLFLRDLAPTLTFNGATLGRVMDGSFQFIAPSGNAGEALVMSLGIVALPDTGIANFAAPIFYPLAAVSNPIAEPIPVLVPLISTALLGNDFRFYLPAAAPLTP